MSSTVQPSPQQESLTRRTLTGSLWSAMATAGRQLLSFLCFGILAHLLGPAAYGLMGMASVLTVFLLNFRDLGISAAIIRRPDTPERLLSSLFWVNVLLGASLSVLITLCSKPISVFFHEPALAPIVRGIAPSFLLASLGIVHNSLLVRRMAFDKIAKADLASVVISYGVAIAAAFLGFGVWSLVFANVATAAVATAGYWYFSGWRPGLHWDGAGVWSVLRFSLNLTGFGVVNYFSRNADNIVIGRYMGSVSLGYYQMAYNLMLYPIQNISGVLAQVLLPAFSRLQDDNERFRSAYLRSCSMISLITFPAMVGLAVVADPFVRVMLGPKWIPVIPVFQILAPVGLVQSVYGSSGQIYVVKGRTGRLLAVATYGAIVFVLSFLAGVRYGILGVAFAYAAAFFTLVCYPMLRIAFSLIDLSFSAFVRKLLPQLVITLAMGGVCYGWRMALRAGGVTSPHIDLFSTAAVGCVVYIALLLRLRPEAVMEVESLIEQTGIARAAAFYNAACRVVGRKPAVAMPT